VFFVSVYAAVVLVFIGLLYCMSGATCQDDRPTAVDLKAGGQGQPASSAGPPAQETMKKAQTPAASSWPNMSPEGEEAL
jgi:hypothetical protein